MRPQPHQHRPHLNGPLRSLLLWLLNQLLPWLDRMAEYRQKCFLAKGNILQMIAIVLRAWMSLKENTGSLPERKNKKIAILMVSLTYMKMQPWEKEKERSTCVGLKNTSCSNIINGMCFKGSFICQLDLECVLPQTIGSIIERVLGSPCKAHHPAFRDYLHKPKTTPENGWCSAGEKRGKSRSAVVKNWALEPDQLFCISTLPSVT